MSTRDSLASRKALVPASPKSRDLSVIVARLREAGCVFAEDEARLLASAARTPSDLTGLVDRRVAGSPLEYILGWAGFCGLRIAVDAGVFVPRRRTELLVREAAALAPRGGGPTTRASSGPRPVIVDLCCGSGAVGAALVASLGLVDLYAVDIEPGAVRCARRNLAVGGRVYEGDLYDPLPAGLRGHVDLLVVNAPYVPSEEIAMLHREARLYEPRAALDGGPDGLHVQRRVAAAAPLWLAPGGHLLLETSELQVRQTVEAVERSDLIARVAHSDDLDATVVIGTRPPDMPNG